LDKEELIEKIAEMLHSHRAGLYPSEYEECMGVPQRKWGSPSQDEYDSDNEFLSEWERDDYRFQSRKVISYLTRKKLLVL